jgi:hypothetical protein
MGISLRPETQKLIEDRMARDGYPTADDVVLAAFELLDEQGGKRNSILTRSPHSVGRTWRFSGARCATSKRWRSSVGKRFVRSGKVRPNSSAVKGARGPRCGKS